MRGEHERELAALVIDRWPTVEATLVGLRAIDGWGRRRGDLRGSFAAAYVIVTGAVDDALRRGIFDDPVWVSQVVIDFAERYRVAVHAALDGARRAASWGPALRRTRGGAIVAVVALLHAMIAHIHYDLAHTLHGCAPIDARRLADYDRLGEVICGTTREIQREILDAYAPGLRGLHRALRGADTWLTRALVRVWRTRARQVAEQMVASPSRAAAWSWRLGLESAALAAGLDVFAWPAGLAALVGSRPRFITLAGRPGRAQPLA